MIEFSLAQEDRDLILKHAQQLDAPLRAKLAFGVVQKGRLAFRFSPELFDALLDQIEFLEAEANPRKTRRQFSRIYDRLVKRLPADAVPLPQASSEPPPGSPAAELRQAIAELMATHEFESIDELNAKLGELVDEMNQHSQPDFDGLSPEQVIRLLQPDWDMPGSAIRLNQTLTLDQLETADFLVNARTFLAMLVEQGGTKVTANGNLNRKFVRAIGEHLRLRVFPRDRFSYPRQVWKESDIQGLEMLRYLLQFAGLVRKYKGLFQCTKRGKSLCGGEMAGELYALLFRTFFDELNLASLDRLEECPGVQATIGYSLLMLQRHARDWIALESLAEKLFLPAVAAEIPLRPYGDLSEQSLIARTRIVRPLSGFGLLEQRFHESGPPPYGMPEAVRITPLFDAFLSFDI